MRANATPSSDSHVYKVSGSLPTLNTAVRHTTGILQKPVPSLNGMQSNTIHRSIALILPDITNPFFYEIARGLDEAVAPSGFGVFTCGTGGYAQREQAYIDQVLRMGVEGIAIVPSSESQPALGYIAERGLAAVLIDRDIPGAVADCVFCDNESGAFEAVHHLLALGHRRIGCITGPPGHPISISRVSGYQAALRSAGLQLDPALLVAGDYHAESGLIAARTLLEMASPPTAIFSCNDLMALGAMAAARRMGLSIPQDLSIVGYDDVRMASLSEPPLTTIEQPKAEFGRQAGRMLLERLANPSLPCRRTMLPTRLRVRNSTMPLG